MDPSEILNSSGMEDFLEITKCKICFNVALKPTTCKKCENVFCKDCIENWHKKSNTCPFRCNNFEIGEESRVIKSILSKFYYSCKKCNNKISLDQFEYHSKTCDIDSIICEKCGDFVKNYYIDTHLKLFCSNYEIPCPLCSAIVKRKQISNKLNLGDSETSERNNYRMKELEEELKLKDEIISNLKRQYNNEFSLFSQNNLNCIPLSNKNMEEYKIKLLTADIKDLFKIDFKEVLKDSLIQVKNFFSVNFIEFYRDNLTDLSCVVLALSVGALVFVHCASGTVLHFLHLHNDNLTDMKIFSNKNNGHNYIVTSSFDSNVCVVNLSDFNFIKINLNFPCMFILITDTIILGDIKGYIKIFSSQDLKLIKEKKIHNERIKFILNNSDNLSLSSYGNDKYFNIINSFDLTIIKT